MTFLPVVERELRVASRRRQTYWRRSLAALVGLAICAWIFLLFAGNSQQFEQAQALFYTLTGLAFVYSLFAGLATADSLSEEKREGTLGLLFLTDLKGYDVVLGKLTAFSVASLYRLMAVFPVLAIPLLLGGLTAAEFWRMVLVLSNTLFVSLAAGMFASTLSQQPQRALVATAALIALIAGGVPALGGLVSAVWNVKFDPSLFLVSPIMAYSTAFDATFKVSPARFWISTGLFHALGWLFLVLASVILPRAWQDRPIRRDDVRGWREAWTRWRFGVGEARAAYRRHWLDINPAAWRITRDRRKPHDVFAVLALGGLAWLGLAWLFPTDMRDPMVLTFVALAAHTLLRGWVAIEACRPMAEDRRTGALELLLSTPLPVPKILGGQLLALGRQFSGAVLVVLLFDLALLLLRSNDRFATGSNESPGLFIAAVLMFLADLYTLAWLGMWQGLTARSTNRAVNGALLRVMVLPWLIYFLFLTALALSGSSQSLDSGAFLVGTWFLIGLGVDFYFYQTSRQRLHALFRTVTTQRFDAPKSRSGGPADQPLPSLEAERSAALGSAGGRA